MRFKKSGGVLYYSFRIFDQHNIINAVFTRVGGISEPPYDTLNIGGTVGDHPERVRENANIALRALDLSIESVYDVWQVHSDVVVNTDRPRPLSQPHIKADAILTDQPAISLLMRFADCVPILLYDPVQQVIGLVHAGWKGTVMKTALRAVENMVSCFDTRPEHLLAGIGPSIGAHHYQVGEDVAAQVRTAFPESYEKLLVSPNGQPDSNCYLDLWTANRLVLQSAGVENIEIAGLCTACHLDEWYSHRGEDGETGRFGVVISRPG
jgi:YfiH family protein